MKTILLLIIAVALSACNATKVTQSWVKENCTEQHSLNPQGESMVYVRCANLYPTEKVKAICPKADVCYFVSDAVIEVKASCGDSTFNVAKIVNAILKR